MKLEARGQNYAISYHDSRDTREKIYHVIARTTKHAQTNNMKRVTKLSVVSNMPTVTIWYFICKILTLVS